MAGSTAIVEVSPVPAGSAPTGEMIGRVQRAQVRMITNVTVDWTRIDYAFYDRLRRGKEPGYEIGGLFALPIARILTSWSLGRGFTIEPGEKSDEFTLGIIQKFADDNLDYFMDLVEDSISLGDSYGAINPDGSHIRISPDQVDLIAEPKGSQNIVGFVVTSKFEDVEVEDTFTMFTRTIKTKRMVNGARVETIETFPNITGLIPIAQFANDRSANEVHGRPKVEPMVNMFSRYNRAVNKSLDGVELLGNPVPTVEGAEDPEETLRALATSTEQFTGSDGVTRTRYAVDFANLPFIVLGTGATLQFRAPQAGFTSDTGRMIEYLFLLMLQSSGIPEWAWGGAIASSKASVEAQMPAFALLIDSLRLRIGRNIHKLLTAWVRTIATFTPGVNGETEFNISFPSIVADDRAQLLNELKFLREDTAITRETALRTLDVVDDPKDEVKRAKQEAEDSLQNQMDQALLQSMTATDNGGNGAQNGDSADAGEGN